MNNIPPCFYRVSIRALVLDDQKRFLFVKEENGKWQTPGGGLDYGETPKDCLTREIKEEMGLDIVVFNNKPEYFYTATKDNNDNMYFAHIVYRVELKNFEFKESEECVEIGFFTKEEASNLYCFKSTYKFLEVFNPDNH